MHHHLFLFVLTMAIVAGAGCGQIKTQENAEAKTLTAENAKTAENKDIIKNSAYSAVSAVNWVPASPGRNPHAMRQERSERTGISNGAGSRTAATDQSMADNEPPLLLGDEPPLSVDNSPNAGPGADNSRCFVCHVNYMQEVLAARHARANIGCKDCHGEGDAHIADESWASGGTGTPPDIMYPRAKINAACMTCHPKDKIDTEQHQVLFASTAEGKVCTDCHGNHRLTHRRCKWK
jgi:hypothetical protein